MVAISSWITGAAAAALNVGSGAGIGGNSGSTVVGVYDKLELYLIH
jgi:hypothetical protein